MDSFKDEEVCEEDVLIIKTKSLSCEWAGKKTFTKHLEMEIKEKLMTTHHLQISHTEQWW